MDNRERSRRASCLALAGCRANTKMKDIPELTTGIVNGFIMGPGARSLPRGSAPENLTPPGRPAWR